MKSFLLGDCGWMGFSQKCKSIGLLLTTGRCPLSSTVSHFPVMLRDFSEKPPAPFHPTPLRSADPRPLKGFACFFFAGFLERCCKCLVPWHDIFS